MSIFVGLDGFVVPQQTPQKQTPLAHSLQREYSCHTLVWRHQSHNGRWRRCFDCILDGFVRGKVAGWMTHQLHVVDVCVALVLAERDVRPTHKSQAPVLSRVVD